MKALVGDWFMRQVGRTEGRGSKLAQGPELCGPAPRVGRDLGRPRSDRPAGERLGQTRAELLRGGIVGALGLAAPAAEALLDQAVLQRMETDHTQDAVTAEPLEGGGQAALKRAELVIHRDPQALEAEGGRMELGGAAVAGGNRLGNQGGEASRPFEQALPARRLERPD